MTGLSPALVKTPIAEAEPSGVSTKGKGVMRKKKKTQREYVAVTLVQSKIESDSDIHKTPKKGEFSRVIRKDVQKKAKSKPKSKG